MSKSKCSRCGKRLRAGDWMLVYDQANLTNNHNVNLGTLMPEIVCQECGKLKCLPWGTNLTDYAYKKQHGYKSGRPRMEYYCSYTCYRKAIAKGK